MKKLFLAVVTLLSASNAFAQDPRLFCVATYKYTKTQTPPEVKELNLQFSPFAGSHGEKKAFANYTTADGRFLMQFSAFTAGGSRGQDMLIIIRDLQLKTVLQVPQPDFETRKISGSYTAAVGEPEELLVKANCEVQ